MEARTNARTGATIAVVIGLVVLATLTAGAVVAIGSSSSDSAVTAAPSASPTTPTTPTTAPPSSPSPDPTRTAGQSASPSSTVTGAVHDGAHSGDLRFFLLTPPKDAEIYGDETGTAVTRDEVGVSADIKRGLSRYGFKKGAQRTYLTGDGAYEISVELLRFGSTAGATGYYDDFSLDSPALAIDSTHPVKAYRLSSGSAESTDAVAALSHQGDVHISITVTGEKLPGRDLLKRLLDQQYQRLATGR
ncbi:hypothetical protein ABZ883_26020 [Streptomyces sp. NPDC046977]|uniref:hypothetical protein n=1 Tax=Streptomyces sp. NPDC046977 TaxID=3154703 RepID=UPI0033E45BF5